MSDGQIPPPHAQARRRAGRRRPSGLRVGLLASVLLAILVHGSIARSEESPDVAPKGWQPRVDFGLGLINQSVKISGSSTLGRGGKGSRAVLTSLLALNGVLASPVITEGLGRPRLYVRGGYKFPVAEEQRLLDEDTVVEDTEFNDDPSLCGSFTPGTRVCEHNVRGEIQIQHLFNAGIGLEFGLPFQFQALQLAVGLEYLGEKLQYTGSVSRTDRGPSVGGGSGVILGTVTLPQAVESEYVHSLGPRLALSADVAESGPISVRFSLETTFSFYLDDYDTRFGATSGTDSESFRVQSKQPFITQAAGSVVVLWR